MLFRCETCGKVIAYFAAGAWILRHAGREYLCDGLRQIRCDGCGSVWEVVAKPHGFELVKKVAA